GDDGDAPNTSGQGGNVFIDRGAIDRVDFFRPRASLIQPLDQSLVAPIDREPALDRVLISGPDLVREFTIQLTDQGIGIDNIDVNSMQFDLLQEGVPLLEGVNYQWRFNSKLGEVIFQSPTAFTTNRRYEIRVKNTPAQVNDPADFDGVKDLARNFLAPNQGDGTTRFFITLTDGVNDAPLNAVPGDQTTPEDTPLVFSSANGNTISVSDDDVALGTNELTVTLAAEHGAVGLGTPTRNAAGTELLFPNGATLLPVGTFGQQFVVDSVVFQFVDVAALPAASGTLIPIATTATPDEVATAVAAALNDPSNFDVGEATAIGARITLATKTGTTGPVYSSSSVTTTASNQITVLGGATVIGERFSVDGVFFTYVDAVIVLVADADQIRVEQTDMPTTVATATADVLNDPHNFGPGAATAAIGTVTLAGGILADADGTAISVAGLDVIVPGGTAVVGEELLIDPLGTMDVFRFVDLAVIPVPGIAADGAIEIGINLTDDGDAVALTLTSALNTFLGISTVTSLDNVVTLPGGVTAAPVIPLSLSGGTLIVPFAGTGATVIGDHISVGGVIFTYIDLADPSVVIVIPAGPAATEIGVNVGDDSTAVAVATATAINAVLGASSATPAINIVTLDGVTAQDGLVTISGDVTLLNQALSGAQFIPDMDYFG
ncbi:MAG: hypothetical protein ABGZ35_21195, partial [Planctomycetaceae bacterium]